MKLELLQAIDYFNKYPGHNLQFQENGDWKIITDLGDWILPSEEINKMSDDNKKDMLNCFIIDEVAKLTICFFAWRENDKITEFVVKRTDKPLMAKSKLQYNAGVFRYSQKYLCQE